MEKERAVIKGARQAEAVIHEIFLSRVVAAAHAAHLRQGDMGFVYEKQKIRWKIIEQGVRGRACGSAREHAGIIFHSGAEADLTEHFKIVFRALLYAPRFNKLALALENATRSCISRSISASAASRFSADVA